MKKKHIIIIILAVLVLAGLFTIINFLSKILNLSI